MKLSAVVITYNEGKDIGRCLSSVQDFVDEIVVLDSGSTDNTCEIAGKFKAQVFNRKFDNFAAQRNFARDKASGSWILSLDADEEIPKALGREIGEAIKTDKYDAYLVPRRNIIFGAEIHHSRFSPDKHVWLFKKTKGRWIGEIHEEAVIDGKVGELKNAKIHHSHQTVSEFMRMLNSYTEFEAGRIKRFSFFRLLYDPLRSFFGRFILKFGFLDGWRGFTLSYLMAIYRATVWLKVYARRGLWFFFL